MQEPNKRDKYLGNPPRKILGTILEVDKRTRKRISMHKALNSRDDFDRLFGLRKVGGRGLASIEDSFDASIQYLGGYIEKSPKNNNNTRNKKTEITRKQNGKKVTIRTFQVINKHHLPRENVNMAKKGKLYERN